MQKNVRGRSWEWLDARVRLPWNGGTRVTEVQIGKENRLWDESSKINKSPQELADGYYWYEAVFLQREEVTAAFRKASDRFPSYQYVPDNFHITTKFRPEPKHESLYGTAVTVHITGYISGTVQDTKDGITSENEGFLAEVSSADKDMQQLLDGCDNIWHITGSYTGGAKYTSRLDFSKAMPVDITMEGVFGMADSEGMMILEKNR